MKVNNSIRRLTRSAKGQKITAPSFSGKTQKVSSKSEMPAYAIGKSKVKDDDGIAGLETAGLPANSTATLLGPRNYYSSILDDYFDPELYNTGSKDSRNQGEKTSINTIYRDMYYHDPICGSAIDIMSQMPFSEFILTGAKDEKTLEPFKSSVANMKMDMFLPSLSVDYLVHGMFCGTTIFNEAEGIFEGCIPQNSDHVSIQPIPIFGRDPLVSLNIGDALNELLNSADERAKRYIDQLPDEYKDGKKTEFTPNPEDVIYIPRRSMLRDFRGVSIFRRLLMFWLMEKALVRGTLDQAFKRQRAVTHMTVGDDEWTPTAEEMGMLADMLLNADLDPVGAVFVTRLGVNISEIKDGANFWKSQDMDDYFIQHKYRALGISETFLDGTASYNAMETVMTTFVEQMKDYRNMISIEMFYDNLFPRISRHHNFKSRSVGIETAGLEGLDLGIKYYSEQMELAKSGGRYFNSDHIEADLFVPQVHWLKRLRPEADEAYITMLDTLSQKGIPIPTRVWASAGGLDMNDMLEDLDDDLKIQQKIADYKESLKDINPPAEGEEGGGGFFGASSDEELNEIIVAASNERNMRTGLGSRTYDPEHPVNEIANYGGGGKRIPSTAKGRKVKEERMHKVIAEAAANVAQTENRKTKDEEKELVDALPTKHYTSASKRKR